MCSELVLVGGGDEPESEGAVAGSVQYKPHLTVTPSTSRVEHDDDVYILFQQSRQISSND